MTQEIAEHLRKLSSRNGRYWLRDSRHAAQGTVEAREDLPFGSVRSSQTQSRTPIHESVVVSIPDVTAQTVNATVAPSAEAAVSQQATAKLPVETRVQMPAPAVQQIPPAPHSFAQLKSTMPSLAPVAASQALPAAPHAVAATPSLVQASQFSALEAAEISTPPSPVPFATSPVSVAHPEPPRAAVRSDERQGTPQEDDAVRAARATQTDGMESSITKIADEIVANFPVASSSVIMLSGSQSALHSDETCARVAAELASRNVGRVLLVDSDFESRRLTKASGMSSQGGLSEIMNIAFPWQEAILKSGSSKLDFMAAGNCPHKRWTPKKLLREALAEIRNDYQFVCVSAGDAHSSAASLWSELSDGALLVVSASQSSEAVAQSAVSQLKASGARMLGCIVADVRE